MQRILKKYERINCLFNDKTVDFLNIAWSITGKTENVKNIQSSGYQTFIAATKKGIVNDLNRRTKADLHLPPLSASLRTGILPGCSHANAP